MLLLSRFDSKLLRKKYCIYFTAVIVLISWPFTAVVGVKGLVDKKGQKISPYKTDYIALEWLEKQPADEENSVQFVTFAE